MGQGYYILLWDSWGGGLVRVNARLYFEGTDVYGNPQNWFPCDENTTADDVIEKHNLNQFKYFDVKFD